MQVIFQAVEKAKSVKPVEVAKALRGGTFDTILGKVTLRAEDHQMVLPNYFGYIGEQGNKLRPIITETIPASVATTPPTGTCNMGEL
jgi:branched-chain amino acid transport system substrate-binding protein